MGVCLGYGACKRFVSRGLPPKFSYDGPESLPVPCSVSLAPDARSGRSGSSRPGRGRRALLRRPLLQRGLEPVAPLLDWDGRRAGRRDWLGAPAAGADPPRGRLLRRVRRLRPLAGGVDRLVDPARAL